MYMDQGRKHRVSGGAESDGQVNRPIRGKAVGAWVYRAPVPDEFGRGETPGGETGRVGGGASGSFHLESKRRARVLKGAPRIEKKHQHSTTASRVEHHPPPPTPGRPPHRPTTTSAPHAPHPRSLPEHGAFCLLWVNVQVNRQPKTRFPGAYRAQSHYPPPHLLTAHGAYPSASHKAECCVAAGMIQQLPTPANPWVELSSTQGGSLIWRWNVRTWGEKEKEKQREHLDDLRGDTTVSGPRRDGSNDSPSMNVVLVVDWAWWVARENDEDGGRKRQKATWVVCLSSLHFISTSAIGGLLMLTWDGEMSLIAYLPLIREIDHILLFHYRRAANSEYVRGTG
ncbi:hypothetical protein BD779DRAFT_1698613 [Infundibulicybe gibba]|nr:hypothetical protein BD779DRAFT_1698613 [Infundibulicybe gibba]